ncbi:MAG: class I SAM-dependent methyltransferase [Alphaproteobacteria bacterium]|nr:class I SAM-dependent methyltransferase [Candidatus Parcubacteria bacterium]NCQ67549.1 class I SAM-dependent methyltransferase [Alphaproteobacteria bacterium]
MTQKDIAGVEYWDKCWANFELPSMFDPNDQSLDNTFYHQIHLLFQKFLSDKKFQNVVEMGGAKSLWPIYFSKKFNCNASVLDYSPIGCEASKKIFKAFGVNGFVKEGSFFDSPKSADEKYDLIISFGVIEHFTDTAAFLKAFEQHLKPGGYIFTLLPNIPGIIGKLQKILDKDVYDVHVPLTKEDILKAHQKCDHNIEFCEYFMPLNLGVVNIESLNGKWYAKSLKRLFSIISKLTWLFDKYIFKLPKTTFFSPYIVSFVQMKHL